MNQSTSTERSWWLWAASVFFVLYLANILFGKAGAAFGFEPVINLGDVGEFLVLFVAVICFIAEVLRREAHNRQH